MNVLVFNDEKKLVECLKHLLVEHPDPDIEIAGTATCLSDLKLLCQKLAAEGKTVDVALVDDQGFEFRTDTKPVAVGARAGAMVREFFNSPGHRTLIIATMNDQAHAVGADFWFPVGIKPIGELIEAMKRRLVNTKR